MPHRTLGEIIRDQTPLIMVPEASVADACAAMHARRVGAVLVAGDDRRLVGIFTGRDAVRLLAEGLDAKATRLDAVMTHNPVTLPPSASAIEALHLLRDCGFRHLPVVREGHAAGIVSRYDFRDREHARITEEAHVTEALR